MDLRSVGAVIGRHRAITTVGVVIALALAFLAAFRVSPSSSPPLERRQATIYESTTRFFVTQRGFPWGRSTLRYTSDPRRPTLPPVLDGDPDRFAQLALLYSQLANSDRVQARLAKADRGAVVAKVVPVSQFSTAPLPMLDISAKASTPGRAQALSTMVSRSLVRFIEKNQAGSGIPAKDRVILDVIDPAGPGVVVGAPSPALPVLVLFTMLLLTIGTVFVLDNWKRVRGVVPASPLFEAGTAPAPEAESAEPAAAAANAPPRPRIARTGHSPSTLGHRRPTLAPDADSESGSLGRSVASAASDE